MERLYQSQTLYKGDCFARRRIRAQEVERQRESTLLQGAGVAGTASRRNAGSDDTSIRKWEVTTMHDERHVETREEDIQKVNDRDIVLCLSCQNGNRSFLLFLFASYCRAGKRLMKIYARLVDLKRCESKMDEMDAAYRLMSMRLLLLANELFSSKHRPPFDARKIVIP